MTEFLSMPSARTAGDVLLSTDQAAGNVSLSETVEADANAGYLIGPYVEAEILAEPRIDLRELVSIAQAKGPDRQQALSEIYKATRESVFHCVFAILHNHHEAEDVTSEVFIRLLNKIDTFEDRGKPITGWLHTVARRAALDYIGSAAARKNTAVEPDLIAQTLLAEDSGYSPDSPWCRVDEAVMNAGFRTALLTALPRLAGTKQAECVRLRFIEDLSVAETAKIMGLQEGAVKTLTVRAMTNLRKVMAEWGNR